MNRVSTRAAKNAMFNFMHLAVLCDTFISINACCYFLNHGLSNPSFFNPSCISGLLINNFHNNPDR